MAGALPTYAVVTPVRDEADHFARTAESIVSQTHRPQQWVVVDDGSTDGTREVAERYAAAHDWIDVISAEGAHERARGAPIVRAFQRGCDALREQPEVVVKLDGDLFLPPHYFEWVAETFARDPRAGIVGGVALIPEDGRWVPERGNVLNVNGVAKAYRVACLDEIGGLRPSMGWDGIDEYGARARGWHVRVLTELTLLHYRPRGSKQNPLKARWEEGRGNAYMGYLPELAARPRRVPLARREAVHRRRASCCSPATSGHACGGCRRSTTPLRGRSCAPSSERGWPASSAAAARPRSSSRTAAARHTGRPVCASRDRPPQPPPAGHRRRRGRPRALARARPRGRRAGDARAGRDPAPARGLPRRAPGRAGVPLRRGPSRRSTTPAIELEVVQGGEAGVMWAVNASDDELRAGSYGGRGTDLLVETPYGPLNDTFEQLLFTLPERGYRLLLAHPENNPTFQRSPERLHELVDRGVLLQVTARSLIRSDRKRGPRPLAEALVRDGRRRTCSRRTPTPGASSGRRRSGAGAAAAAELVGEARAQWLVEDAPAAILAGEPLPEGAARRVGSAPPAAAYFRDDAAERRSIQPTPALSVTPCSTIEKKTASAAMLKMRLAVLDRLAEDEQGEGHRRDALRAEPRHEPALGRRRVRAGHATRAPRSGARRTA